MKLLVATNQEYTEFCYVPEGEIVANFGIVCCSSAGCGCNRSISGTKTFCATTTAKVAEVDIKEGDLFDLAAKAGRESGWGGPHLWEALQAAAAAAKELELGTIVEPHFNFDSEKWEYKPVDPQVIADAESEEKDKLQQQVQSALAAEAADLASYYRAQGGK